MKKEQTEQIILVTDGSVYPNPGDGGWSAILVKDSTALILVGTDVSVTNNRMETKAVLEGLQRLKRPCMITLITDSQYVINGFYRIINGREVLTTHEDLWKAIEKIYKKQVALRLSQTKGHQKNTNALHKIADKLAHQAALREIGQMEKYVALDSLI